MKTLADRNRRSLLASVARVVAVGVLASVPLTHSVEAQPMCVDFEAPLAPGTQYGGPPPRVVFTSGRIGVAIDLFYTPLGSAFGYAEIDPSPPTPIGSGQAVRTNNINLVFIFSQVGFIPRRVTLAYLDLGGNENISVNGDPFPAFIGELANAPPAMGGANVVVTPSSGGAGKVEIDGAVFILKIGGQEFWLDDVCVHEK